MHLPDPVFPPLFTGHAVNAPRDPVDEALSGIAAGDLGAGDIVWSRNTDRLSLALILEPEVARDRAVEMLPLAVVALGDALGALVPAELPITWRWPATIKADGARIGSLRMIVGPNDAAATPAFLIVGVSLVLREHGKDEPGKDPDNTTLYDEGCEEVDRTRLIESFSRHFLTWLHRWQDEGFAPVHEAYLFRADHYRGEMSLQHRDEQVSGRFSGLDEHGNLLLEVDGSTVELALLDSEAATLQEAARA